MKRKRAGMPPPRSGRTGFGLGILLLAGLGFSALLGACSVLVESATDQCKTDVDCHHFANGSVCKEGICVLPGGSSSSSSGSGGGGDACFSGTPTKDVEYLNKCTTAECVEFDNCARLGLCNGAALPALVAPPPP